jgi:hypothetical protein
MVRVPTVSLRPVDLPNMQAPTVSPMQNAAPQQIGQMGQALEQGGKAAVTIGDYLQDRINDASAMKRLNNFRERLQQSATSVEGGWLNTQGENALKNYGAARKQIDDMYKEEMGFLENDIQKELFQRQANLYRGEWMSRLDQHTNREHKAFYTTELKRTAEGRFQDAANALRNPQDAPMQGNMQLSPEALLKAAEDSLTKYYSEQGFPADSETVKRGIQDAKDKAFQSAISGAVDDENISRAQELLQQAQGQVSPNALSAQQKLVQKADDEKQSILYAESLRQQFPGNLQAQSDALMKAFQDPEQKMSYDKFKLASAHLKQQYDDGERAKAMRGNELYNAAVNRAIQGTDAMTPEQFLSVTEREELAKVDRLDEFYTWWNSGLQRRTDPDVMQAFMRQSDEEISKLDPAIFEHQYSKVLSPDDMQSALARIRVARKNATPKDVEINEMNQAFQYHLNQQGWYVSSVQAIAGMQGEQSRSNKEMLEMYTSNLKYHVRAALDRQDEATRRLNWNGRMMAAWKEVTENEMVTYEIPITGKDALIPRVALSLDELEKAKVKTSQGDVAVTNLMPGLRLQQGAEVTVSALVKVSEDMNAMMQKHPGAIPVNMAVQTLGIPKDYIEKLPESVRKNMQLSMGVVVDYFQKNPPQTAIQKEWAAGMPKWYIEQQAKAWSNTQAGMGAPF